MTARRAGWPMVGPAVLIDAVTAPALLSLRPVGAISSPGACPRRVKFLMLAGIAVFGVVSANLAALFIREPERANEDELLREIAELKAMVNQLVNASSV